MRPKFNMYRILNQSYILTKEHRQQNESSKREKEILRLKTFKKKKNITSL
jgi:hypothetical protein